MEKFLESELVPLDTISKLKELLSEYTTKEKIKELLVFLENSEFTEKLEEFDTIQKQLSPTFKMLRDYMAMVECLLNLVRFVRSGDWNGHITSVEAIVPYFFALDMHNYSGMMAYYLADMKNSKTFYPSIWKEFEEGNWVVKKSITPFCAVGADEALEHQNRAMRVTGGIAGITQQPSALARYFLTAPVLEEISKQVSSIPGVSAQQEVDQKPHYESQKILNKEDNAIKKKIEDRNKKDWKSFFT